MNHQRFMSNLWKVVTNAMVLFWATLSLMPFAFMVSTSFKPLNRVFTFPPQWIPDPFTWANYRTILNEIPYMRFFFNSAYTSVLVTVGATLVASLAAYAFARLRFPGRDKLFLVYLGTMMIPGQVTLLPIYIMVRQLGWLDSHLAIIVPGMFNAFGVFLLRQFFLSLPRELEEAALIDGCGYFRIFTTIILPLSKPGLTALLIFTFLEAWNSFMMPLIMISSEEKLLLTVGLSMLQNLYVTNWSVLMAGSVLTLLPVIILFLVAQKQFIGGITLTGLKG